MAEPRVRDLCDELHLIDADRWTSEPERLSFGVYSSGTVAAGTGISIYWIPPSQHQEMVQEAQECRYPGSRVTIDHLSGPWWMVTGR